MDLVDALRISVASSPEAAQRLQNEAASLVLKVLTTKVSFKAVSILAGGPPDLRDDLVQRAMEKSLRAFTNNPKTLASMVSDGEAHMYLKSVVESTIVEYIKTIKDGHPCGEAIDHVEDRTDPANGHPWEERLASGEKMQDCISKVYVKAIDHPAFPVFSQKMRQRIEKYWEHFFLYGSGTLSSTDLAIEWRPDSRRVQTPATPGKAEVDAFLRSFKRARELVVEQLCLAERCPPPSGIEHALLAKLEFVYHCWQRTPADLLNKIETRVQTLYPDCPQ
jgi:hypothetical protein